MTPCAQPDLSPTGPEIIAANGQRRRARPAAGAWGINVIVVEDDEADAKLMLDVLQRDPNVARVVHLDAPDYALAQLQADRVRPDLILLDIHMPKMDGFQFLAALDRMPAARATPVVMITTSRYQRDVDKARQSSACGYIVKPDEYDELKRRLHAVVIQAVTGKWSG